MFCGADRVASANYSAETTSKMWLRRGLKSHREQGAVRTSWISAAKLTP